MGEPKMPFHMARNSVRPSDLMTMQEIADFTGKSYQYIRALNCGAETLRKGFPEPFTTIGKSPLWKRSTIKEWLKH